MKSLQAVALGSMFGLLGCATSREIPDAPQGDAFAERADAAALDAPSADAATRDAFVHGDAGLDAYVPMIPLPDAASSVSADAGADAPRADVGRFEGRVAVTLMGTSTDGYGRAARATLESWAVPYEYVDLSSASAEGFARVAACDGTDRVTVPTLLIDRRPAGACTVMLGWNRIAARRELGLPPE